MSKIKLLHPSVAERIAAGEVIERPASVVKELVENSLDAGAIEITVYLEDGGKGLIEVIDNGLGMDRDDLALAVKRHATSKLQELSDLEKIKTLGFRGEALPSVAAVSDLTIHSRARGEAHTYEWNSVDAEPKLATFGHFLGSEHGTRIQARGLFSQVPARLKFLKSQGSEVSQVREWIERLAFTHPHVGFKLVSDERTILNLRPGDEVSRVKQILSDGDDYPVVTIESDQRYQGFTVRVHWLQGMSLPQTKKLVQVVNRRALRDRFLQQAVLMPFKQALLPGQFPALALFLEINPSEIDVNVHPTKTEIRFLDNRKIFHVIESLTSSMISKHGAPNYATLSDISPMTAAEPTAAFGFSHPGYSSPQSENRLEDFKPIVSSNSEPSTNHAPSHPFSGAQLSGVIFNTYLIYDFGAEAVLIDQHAAHERIRFEKLKKRFFHTQGHGSGTSQLLLIPEAVKFAPEKRSELEEKLPWLTRLGFESEIFGEDAVLFRAAPPEWGTQSLQVRLKNLIERLLDLKTKPASLIDEAMFEKIASEACHSAIRAGDRVDVHTAQMILNDLFSCEHPWNCPHGRPTVVRIPKTRFEEWFQRKV